jgi:hypothetical protein
MKVDKMYGLLLHWVPWIYNRILYGSDKGYRVITNIYRTAIIPIEYYFVQHSRVPISSSSFSLDSIPEKHYKWTATLGPARFIHQKEPTASIFLKNCSWLGLSITLPETGTLDLSDWISDVKYAGPQEPTPLEIFTLWCIDTGKPYFLYVNETTQVDLIDELGEIVVRRLIAEPPSLEQNAGQVTGSYTDRSLDSLFSPSGC